MAYGNNSGTSNTNKGFVPKTNSAPAPARTSAPVPNVQSGAPKKESNKLFAAFKNKGQGYSVVLKEDITIPAGTRIGVFQDILKGKDGTEYEVMNVTKLPERTQA